MSRGASPPAAPRLSPAPGMRLLLLLLACLLLEAAGQGQQPPREAAQAAADGEPAVGRCCRQLHIQLHTRLPLTPCRPAPAAVAALLSLPAATRNWADATRALAGSDWVNGTPCGSGTAPPWKGVTCNAARQVAEVALGGLGLQGTLPPELAALASATKLDLSRNAFNGTVGGSRLVERVLRFATAAAAAAATAPPPARAATAHSHTRGPCCPRLCMQIPDSWRAQSNFKALEVIDLSSNLLGGERRPH